MTPAERIAEIEARTEAVEALSAEFFVSEDGQLDIHFSTDSPDGTAADYVALAAFIANARQDVPWLLAEVKRLREALETSHTAFQRWEDDCHDLGVEAKIKRALLAVERALDGES